MVYVIGFWIVCGIVGAIIGSGKNAGGTGFLLGVLLGPLGLLAAFAVDNREKCPHCSGRLNGQPQICEHCSKPLVWHGEDAGQGEFGIRCNRCKKEYVNEPLNNAGLWITCRYCKKWAILQRFRKASKLQTQAVPEEPKLKPCPDCGRQVSRRATSCPGCGCPLS